MQHKRRLKPNTANQERGNWINFYGYMINKDYVVSNETCQEIEYNY